MQKSIENSKEPKLPPVGTILVVTSTKDTNYKEVLARVGFLCRVTSKTELVKEYGLKPYLKDLDFNFKENEFIYSEGVWCWYCHELEEITLIQEDK